MDKVREVSALVRSGRETDLIMHLYMEGVNCLANETNRPTYTRKFNYRLNSASTIVRVTPLAIGLVDGGGIIHIWEHTDGDPICVGFQYLNDWIAIIRSLYDIPTEMPRIRAMRELASEVEKYVEWYGKNGDC